MKARLLALLLSVTLTACNLGAPAPQEPADAATAAALTVEAVLTIPAASPTSDGPPAGAPGFAVTDTPRVAIDGTTAEPAECTNQSSITSWMRDGLPYDTTEANKPLKPDQGFVMSWVIKNTGTCVWDSNYKLIYDSGERLTELDSQPVMPGGYRVDPGIELTISAQMKAPTKPGSYESTYRFVSADGESALIVGVITTVGTATNSTLSAPGDLRYAYDCSGGTVRISLIWQDRANDEAGYRIYRDGAKLADLPAGATVYDDIAPSPGSYQYTVAAFNAGGESAAKVQAETTNCQ